MRTGLIAVSVLALAACSKAPETSAPDRPSYDVAESPPAAEAMTAGRAAPGIAVTAAPGVAFNYHYAFSLSAERVATAQEAHAQACEKLGIARCRITGMAYRLVGENDVQAQLAFKLDPAIARAFGKNGIDIVKSAEGTLTEAEITGTDAGAAIDRLSTEKARAGDELKRIDSQLAVARSAAERAELQSQRAEIARRIAAASDETSDKKDSLANTPMVFDYTSGAAIRGFDASAPVKSAVDMALGSAQVTIGLVLGTLAILGPPAIVLFLLWLLWRRFGPAIRRRDRAAPTPPAD